MTAPELAYRHPKRGKAHRAWFPHLREAATIMACGLDFNWAHRTTARAEVMTATLPVDSLDPADLCKRCWPERAK